MSNEWVFRKIPRSLTDAEAILAGRDIRPLAPNEFLSGPGGEMATEYTATVKGPSGGWMNVPTIWSFLGSPFVADEEMSRGYALGLLADLSVKPQTFATPQEAARAAETASRLGGRSFFSLLTGGR